MTYFDSRKKEDCMGCGICELLCPSHAIQMQEDLEGFFYPVINKDKCNQCGLCQRSCPNKEYEINKNTRTYIAINQNKKELNRSSSGGVFFALAKQIIKNNGVVFGVKYEEDLKVVHDFATTLKELEPFQGSKYVGSDVKDSYQKVKEFLSQKRQVLFTGTPCQCQGLRSYLKKEDPYLYTCEIICHANPSPKVFELYKKNLERTRKKKIKKIEFRSKKLGWNSSNILITYEDGSKEKENTFYQAFIQELINRPSCHQCHFSSSNRLSDFTIGDMWGIEKIDPHILNDNTGISLLCTNTKKARLFLKNMEQDLFLKEVEKEKSFEQNHHQNKEPHKKRNQFFRKMNEKNVIKQMKRNTKTPFLRRVLYKVKKGLTS